MDKTKHINPEEHGAGIKGPIPHTAKWYASRGGKCPVCGVDAESTL